ncbi:MAG: NYN domain-containing protein [Erysipelotrichaceae bacterium]|nr:NYN domain-containing protein [Erysipelotrichaceae bacterium]
MKRIILGAIAHVDAGKTSLCEALLYETETIRHKGRVDSEDSFLDYNDQERARGITIFNKEARFTYKDSEYIYLDTPGHNELRSESIRALSVIDTALLIIDGSSNIPSDTISIFNNLLNYHIPIIIFINKMDISYNSKDKILNDLKDKLSSDCTDLKHLEESTALKDEKLLDDYLNNNLDKKEIIRAINENDVIPVLYGSALKEEGIKELLNFIDEYIETKETDSDEFKAYVYRITYEDNERISHLKLISGTLKNKDVIAEHKINEIRIYSGKRYTPVNEVTGNNLIAVKGLDDISIGTYLPSMVEERNDTVLPLRYELKTDEDATLVYSKISVLNEENPELKIELEHHHIYIHLNGDLQKEIISRQIKERFGIDVSYSEPIIRYKETITKESYGVGHFEPLRHYAEVIVSIKPSDKGLRFNSLINNSYTATMINYLNSYHPRGILTNSELENTEITIVDFKTHPKHTEGGDLINALRRAIRHALSKNESELLEPYYLISIDTDNEKINRIIPELINFKTIYTIEENQLMVKVPVLSFNSLILSLRQRLKDELSYEILGSVYDECKNDKEVIERYHYSYLDDRYNPAGSIFTSKGAGHYVDINEVEEKMHLNLSDYFNDVSVSSIRHNPHSVSEEELKRVWNSLYKEKPRIYKPKNEDDDYHKYEYTKSKPLIYLVDGYNLLYSIDELKDIAQNDFISAREKVIDICSDFKGYVAADLILVFDAYKQDSIKEKISSNGPITIVYTKMNQKADTYIENTAAKLKNDYKVISVTSDYLEQMKLVYNDSSIISSREFMMRYNNFRKNTSYKNNIKPNRPLSELRKILEEEDETIIQTA